MLVIKDIEKRFGDNHVLKGISGTFDKGISNLIIGASGTGKSVLLKVIVGLIPPDQGNVIFDDRDFYNGDKEQVTSIRKEIGMLFQGGALFDSKTVEENVRFPLEMRSKMALSEMDDRVNTVLKRVGLEGTNKKMTSEISGGMKKRVGIARAIVSDIKYLFCDEPNSGLDPKTAIKIDDLIHDITHELNLTTIVVTHDMNSVLSIGEKIMFLHDGHKVWEGDSNTIFDSDVESLQEFVFAGKYMYKVKEALKSV